MEGARKDIHRRVTCPNRPLRWASLKCYVRREGPEHSTDAARLVGGGMFVTQLPERTRAAGANATRRHDAHRSIMFGPALVRGERAISGAAQGAIGLQRKSGARKPSSERACSPLRRTRSYRPGSGWLTGSDWQNRVSWSTCSRAHHGEGQVLAEFQSQVPKPLSQDLNACLSPGRVSDPTVGILLSVFISQDGFQCTAMQGEIQHIVGAEGWVETHHLSTLSPRCSPTAGGASVAERIATISRSTGPAAERGRSGVLDGSRWRQEGQPARLAPQPGPAPGHPYVVR